MSSIYNSISTSGASVSFYGSDNHIVALQNISLAFVKTFSADIMRYLLLRRFKSIDEIPRIKFEKFVARGGLLPVFVFSDFILKFREFVLKVHVLLSKFHIGFGRVLEMRVRFFETV